MSKLIRILKDINELIVFKHSIFALPFIFVAMIVASKSLNNSIWFGWELLILGILCIKSCIVNDLTIVQQIILFMSILCFFSTGYIVGLYFGENEK